MKSVYKIGGMPVWTSHGAVDSLGSPHSKRIMTLWQTQWANDISGQGCQCAVLIALAAHSQLATTQKYLDLRPRVIGAAVELV